MFEFIFSILCSFLIFRVFFFVRKSAKSWGGRIRGIRLFTGVTVGFFIRVLFLLGCSRLVISEKYRVFSRIWIRGGIRGV